LCGQTTIFSFTWDEIFPSKCKKKNVGWPCETIEIARPIFNNYTKINENIENVYNVVGTDNRFLVQTATAMPISQ